MGDGGGWVLAKVECLGGEEYGIEELIREED